jgi:glycosyltransferase involved in cell wall biosynthesis
VKAGAKVAVDLRALMETGGKISGVENYTLNVVNELERMHAGSFEYTMNAYRDVVLPAGLNASVTGKIHKSSVPNKLLNASLTVLHAPKFESLYGKFDVLWMPDIRPFAIKAAARLVVTVHDISPFVHPEFYSLKRRIWHSIAGYRRALARADVVIAVSEYTKADLEQFFGLDAGKVKVVYPGIDHEKFKPNLDAEKRERVRTKYALPNRFVLAISTLEPRKNILTLVRAFSHVTDPDVHLVIAGRRGWLYEEIFKAIAASAAREKIHYVDYVDEADKPYLILLAEILCYPSFYEGFGFQVAEAMACGVPVITSARTSMPEVSGGAAFLVEPHQLTDLVSAMNALLGSAQLRAAYIDRGLARAKDFSWQNTAAQISAILLS